MTLEFIIAFPLIFIAGLAIVEFFFLTIIIEGATTALNEGARQAAEAYPNNFQLDINGADNDIADKVVEVMNQHLKVYNLEIYDPVNLPGGSMDDLSKQNAAIIIQRNGNSVTRPAGGLTNQSGVSVSCSAVGPGAPANSDEVIVTLCFEYVDSATPKGDDDPVPDWLASFGFTLEGAVYEMTSRASLE